MGTYLTIMTLVDKLKTVSTKCTTPLLVLISVAITFADPADDLIETPLPLLMTSIFSPPTVATEVVPLGISPAMILFGKTCLKRIAFNVLMFSGFTKDSTVPAGSLANASSVGANTVKSPLPLSVSAKPAALTAANKVDSAGVAAAVPAMVFRAGAAVLPAACPLDDLPSFLHHPGDLPHLHPPGAAVAMATKERSTKANEFMMIRLNFVE